MPTLFLIDGNSQMYRAYHAIRGLTGPDGRSTNAVYGFTTMLRKLIADHQPEYIAASFDIAGPTFREDLPADYKANRTPMPPDLVEQVPLVHEACEAMGVPILTYERFEADDVIGTLARQAHAQGFDVAIVTGDKDFFQLVTDGIRVYNPRDDGTWYDAEGVVAKFGVRPDQVVDVLALMGDSVDNIKGVPGIGEKGARELISTHGTLDALLQAAPSVTQKRYREALLAHADAAHESRELARIRTDVPVTFDPDALRYRGPSRDRCFALFSSLGFRTLVADFAPTAETAHRQFTVAGSLDDIDALAAEIRQAGRVALAPIAAGGSAVDADVVGWAYATAAGSARYVPMAHTGLADTPNLRARDVFEKLAPLLSDPAVAKIGHDLKFAIISCARAGRDARRRRSRHDDRQLSRRRHPLRSLARGTRARADRLPCRHARRGGRQGRQGGRRHVGATHLARRLCRRARRVAARALDEPRRRSPHEWARLGLPRSRTAAHPRARRHRARRHPRGRRRAGGPLHRHAARARRAGRGHLHPGRRRVQHQLAEAARRGPVHETEPAGHEEDRQDPRDVHRAGRARGAGRRARAARPRPQVAQHSETQRHVRRRAARARQPGDRARAHYVQPGRGRHRPAQQQRPEPAEHPDPHRARPARSGRPSSPTRARC